MTDRSIELTRRKILGSVGAVGIAGVGAGELSDAIEVTVSHAESVSLSNDQITCTNTRELNNWDGYTV